MSEFDIIRAWKDPTYREGLSQEELDRLPSNPAGLVELSESDLLGIGGGTEVEPMTTIPCITAIGTVISALSIAYCSPNNTFCGTCEYGTEGCCHY